MKTLCIPAPANDNHAAKGLTRFLKMIEKRRRERRKQYREAENEALRLLEEMFPHH